MPIGFSQAQIQKAEYMAAIHQLSAKEKKYILFRMEIMIFREHLKCHEWKAAWQRLKKVRMCYPGLLEIINWLL